MSLSKNIDRYRDIEQYFNAALLNEHGGTVVLKDYNAAIQWRQRAYFFRQLYAEKYRESFMLSSDVRTRAMAGKSPWDDFILIVEKGDNKVHIRPQADPVLEFIPADGVMPEARELTPTELMDLISGPAEPIVNIIPGISPDVARDDDDKFSPDKPLF